MWLGLRVIHVCYGAYELNIPVTFLKLVIHSFGPKREILLSQEITKISGIGKKIYDRSIGIYNLTFIMRPRIYEIHLFYHFIGYRLLKLKCAKSPNQVYGPLFKIRLAYSNKNITSAILKYVSVMKVLQHTFMSIVLRFN